MNYKQVFAVKAANEKRIRALYPDIIETSGIYVFTREENGFKYAYVGQAVNVLKRAAEHLSGFQHIDLSIKKHGLYDIFSRPNGWKLVSISMPRETLDYSEQYFVKQYADLGYQLRNETTGSQGEGKKSLNDYGRGGYLKGKRDGEQKAVKSISETIGKYTTGLTSKGGAIADRKTAELIEILKGVSRNE